MKFEEYRLSTEVKRNLYEMGFRRPTDIQFKCIPHIQRGEDELAIALTGIGNTAAFAMHILVKIQHIQFKDLEIGRFVRPIVMETTRELASQNTQVFT